MKEVTLAEVSLAGHTSTGFTRHEVHGQIMPMPMALKIVRLGEGPGVYLYYLGPDGNEMNDTWHEEIAGAFRQAELEFKVAESEWAVFNE